MAALPTECCWCVLEFGWCNSFVVVQCAFWQQFGHRGPPETSIRRWYEQFCYRGCICHQGKGRTGRPNLTEEKVDRVCKTFTHSPRKSVRRASQELKILELVTMKLQTFLFQTVVTPCTSVQYLWKYGFAKYSDNLYTTCICLWHYLFHTFHDTVPFMQYYRKFY
jgi:hypothetical protein